MFEKSLAEKLGRIFGLNRVSYEAPKDETREQECIFIKVDKAMSSIREGVQKARAQGSIVMYVNSEKMPFGFINKKIQQARSEDTKDLFFYNIDQNQKYYGNLVERSSDFVYFHSAQYDPNQGEINSIEFTLTDGE